MDRPLDKEETDRLLETAKEQGPPKTSPVNDCDRLTGHFSLIHESCGIQPVKAHGVFTKMLTSKEQPYQRRLQVGEAQTRMEIGWIENPGYLVIENKKTLGSNLNPTTEQRQSHEDHRIFVAVNGLVLFEIPPNQAFIACLHDKDHVEAIGLLSSVGTVPVHITVMPR